MKFSFTQEEHLKSKKQIDALFTNGKTLKAYPLFFVYTTTPISKNPKPQVGFSVAKRKIKLAVKRNLLKRRIKECYRLNHLQFLGDTPLPFAGMFLYQSNQIESQEKLQRCMQKILSKLKEELSQNSSN